MRAYSALPNDEFVRELREAAIRSKASPLVIDAIDNLSVEETQSERIEELENKIEDLESEIAELKEQLDAKSD